MKVYDIFLDFLRTKGLKMTKQRETVLSVLVKSDRHLSVDELYDLVKTLDSSVSHTTVFRTAKLLVEADIASTIDFGDRISRFEITYGHHHHDHLVCVQCGKYIEAEDDDLGTLQKALEEKYGFKMLRQKVKILGLCKNCQ